VDQNEEDIHIFAKTVLFS